MLPYYPGLLGIQLISHLDQFGFDTLLAQVDLQLGVVERVVLLGKVFLGLSGFGSAEGSVLVWLGDSGKLGAGFILP